MMDLYQDRLERECADSGGCTWRPEMMVKRGDHWWVRYGCSHCTGEKEETYKDQPYELDQDPFGPIPEIGKKKTK